MEEVADTIDKILTAKVAVVLTSCIKKINVVFIMTQKADEMAPLSGRISRMANAVDDGKTPTLDFLGVG